MNRLGFITACMSGIVVTAINAAMVACPGCKTIPSTDTIRTVARLCGSATGFALAGCITDPQAADAITSLVRRLDKVIPNEGETLQNAWLRVAQLHTDILVANRTVSPEVGAAIMAGFGLVTKGYALLVIRHPEIASYVELTSAAVGGFADGLVAAYERDNHADGMPADPEVLGALLASREYKMLAPRPL